MQVQKVDMVLMVQSYIPRIPQGKDGAWQNATRNDTVTWKTWKDIWINNNKENSACNFSANSVYQLYGKLEGKAVILMGSGPSLRKNWKELVGSGDGQSLGRKDIKIVSSLHNFPFCEDNELMTADDYYVVLDAGDITIKEISEGGKHDDDWYWERTQNRTLIACTLTHPELIKRWKGKIYWYCTPAATPDIAKEMMKYTDLTKVPGFNVGGNVMGASLYFARSILGCSIPIFIGMDLAFSYDHKFHPWQSQYDDKFSGVMPWTDIFGNRVYTWGSYFGFKNWFDFIACGGAGNNPHIFINATEGGIMGAYHEGNIQQIIQLDLKTALRLFNMYTQLPKMLEKSDKGQMHLLF